MTETAPASSAMRACSTFMTSMMTPPLSISARPTLRRSVVGELEGVVTVAVVDVCHVGSPRSAVDCVKGCSIPCLRIETWGTQQAEMVPETLF